MTRKVERSRESFEELFFHANVTYEVPMRVEVDLNVVFASRATGFRELLTTVVFARLIDYQYDPTVELYECHPRPLYEQIIRPVLRERGVPCGQSGPLNVAKAAKSLNEQWAAQRRPPQVAQAMLRLIEEALTMRPAGLGAFARELGVRFDALALEVVLTKAYLPPVDSSAELARVARHLIDRHPLGGATPQLLVGVALEAEFLPIGGACVEGARDSVSTTNLTSGKVGDVAVTIDGALARVYEVTIKPFTPQRIDECVQSIDGYFSHKLPEDMVVIVLCRQGDVPADCKPTSDPLFLGELIRGGIVFEFVNIYGWLAGKLAELPLTGRRYFFEQVQDYLNGSRVPKEVRQSWINSFS
ncbi:hypothetical protein [Mycobacterium sp. 1165178.9]|uniref:hypothetical protein n=1 Tax=Mycobacterium sp. 1165178.9 TaxID=1834070 RepID=UPI0012EA539D|nr:hypothetical protein [Mycobacterium sp. 1165178.9]